MIDISYFAILMLHSIAERGFDPDQLS